MPRERSLDINDELDLAFAEFLQTRRNCRARDFVNPEPSEKVGRAGRRTDPSSNEERIEQPGEECVEQPVSASGAVLPAKSKGFVRRIVEGTFHYGLGQAIPKFIQFLLLPVYTLVLSPAEYGGIDLSIKFGGFLMTLMRQGVPGAVARFYYDHDEGPALRDYVTTVARFMLVSSLVVVLVAVVVCPWVLGSLIPGLPLPLALLAILSAIAFCNGELQNRLVQAREQASYQARLNIARASISIVLAILFVLVLRTGAPGVLAAEVVSYGVLTLVAIRYLRAELKGRFRWPLLRSSLLYGWGMMPGDFVGNLAPLLTATILVRAQSAAAVGLFFIAVKVSQPLNLMGLAFQQAYNPIYFSVRKEEAPGGIERLAVTTRNVWAAAIGAAIAAALWGPPLIRWILPVTYHAAAPLIPIFAVGFLGLMAYNFFGPEIFYSKKTWLVPIIVYSSAAVDITISALTAEKYGATGVAWGIAARWLISALIAGIISCRLVTIGFPWFSLLRITVCGLAAAAIASWKPVDDPLVAMGVGILGIALYPVLLWLSGDPAIRDAAMFVRRRLLRPDAQICPDKLHLLRLGRCVGGRRAPRPSRVRRRRWNSSRAEHLGPRTLTVRIPAPCRTRAISAIWRNSQAGSTGYFKLSNSLRPERSSEGKTPSRYWKSSAFASCSISPISNSAGGPSVSFRSAVRNESFGLSRIRALGDRSGKRLARLRSTWSSWLRPNGKPNRPLCGRQPEPLPATPSIACKTAWRGSRVASTAKDSRHRNRSCLSSIIRTAPRCSFRWPRLSKRTIGSKAFGLQLENR